MNEWMAWLPWGRHGLFVGGSLLLCLVALAIELLMLRRQRRTVLDSLQESHEPRRAPVLSRKGMP